MVAPDQSLVELEAFNAKIAPRKLDDLMFYTGFEQNLLQTKHKEIATALNARMRLTWQMKANSQGKGNAGKATDVLNGQFDAYIDASASDIKTWDRPIDLRLNHEMNGNWHTYGYEKETGAEYGEGWRYVWNRVHVTNKVPRELVRWVWCPNVVDGSSKTAFAPFWPGHEYVDVLALDGYQRLPASTVKQPAELFAPSEIAAIRALAPGKPLYLSEVGVAEDPRFSKAEWFTNLAKFCCTASIAGLGYWNREFEGDCTINSSGSNPAAETAFVNAMNLPPFSDRPAALSH